MNRYAFVCHPLNSDTPEGIQKNIDSAKQYGAKLLEKGWCPIVTHLMLQPLGADDRTPQVRQMAMQLSRDLITLLRPAVFVCGDHMSKGMSEEWVIAMSYSMHVIQFRKLDDVIPGPEEIFK